MVDTYAFRARPRRLSLQPSNDTFDVIDMAAQPAAPPSLKPRLPRLMQRRTVKLLLDLALFNLGVVFDALGLFVLLFLVMGGFTIDGLFSKMAVMSLAFLFGTPEQQVEIRTQILCVGLLFFNLAVIARAGSLKAIFDAHRGGRHGR